ncbi:hypothetical protein CWI36_2384p0010 [Hamiltosporidium magnivora]|uniref:Uncharacterized protein n=1 Tax=Hamiltosporidium magnivora TaxID=148818 RepID=A0A4V2JU24_9MICR|nr:hypothetical protein CWI36_2384p0010 [Hamiltosporidium magnivora]
MRYILEFLLYMWTTYAFVSSEEEYTRSDDESGNSMFEWKVRKPMFMLRNNKRVKVSTDEMFEEVVDKRDMSVRVFKRGCFTDSTVVYKPKYGNTAYILEVAHSENVDVVVDPETSVLSVNVSNKKFDVKPRVQLRAIRSNRIREINFEEGSDSEYNEESESSDFRPVIPDFTKEGDKPEKEEEAGEAGVKRNFFLELNSDIREFPRNKILKANFGDADYYIHYTTQDADMSVDKEILEELKEKIELDCNLDIQDIKNNTCSIKRLLANKEIRENLNMESLLSELKDSEVCKEGYRNFREKCCKHYKQFNEDTVNIDGILRESRDKCQEVSRFLISGDCCQLIRMGFFVQMCSALKSTSNLSYPYEELLLKSFCKQDMGITRFFLDTVICMGKTKDAYIATLLKQWNSYITNHWYSYQLAREKYRNEKDVCEVIEQCCAASSDVMEGWDVPHTNTLDDIEETEEEKERKRNVNTRTQKKSSSGIWGKVGIAAVVITAGIIIGGFCWYIF